MFKEQSVSCEMGGRKLTISTGKLARQADGAVMVTYGDTQVLVTAVSAKKAKEGMDFFPLTVEYQEKFYASGRIPGGFFKREGRPASDAILMARMIDRPIRPLFPEGYRNDTQIVATVLSIDKENDPEIAASIGASAALHISDIPFAGPTASCRVGRVDGKLVSNLTREQAESSDMDIFITGTKGAIMMVEGGAQVVPEAEVLEGLLFGHAEIKKVCELIEELRTKTGATPKREVTIPELDATIVDQVKKLSGELLNKALSTQDKQLRYETYDAALTASMDPIVTKPLEEGKIDKDTAASLKKTVSEAFGEMKYRGMRDMILNDKKRIDGRGLTDVRQIEVEAGLLNRVHGSALFTRGETQVLAAVTLGTGDDEQMIDALRGMYKKNFMLHYNFPPFSVGEAGRIGSTSRREIGHGALAERAIQAVLPKGDDNPYTIRVVCEVLESNGSSSMGSVCSASMALMNAGVKFDHAVAGIAMGLIKEDDGRTAVLSDILGDEDHLGDMDFKVAGTKDGVTSIQMDIKIEGVNEEIMKTALQQAHEGRLHILSKMEEGIVKPATQVSDYAPRFTTLKIKPDKIREVIGSGGKVIKNIVEVSGAKVDIEDDGTIKIAAADPEAGKKAEEMIAKIVEEPEVDKVYQGKVKSIVDFGAFVEILPGTDGLLHVSEIAHVRVNNVNDYFEEGDEFEVKVLDVDRAGRVKLSRKVLLSPDDPENEPKRDSGPPQGDSGRGGRGDRGDRGGRGGRGGGDRGRGGRGGGRGRDRSESRY